MKKLLTLILLAFLFSITRGEISPKLQGLPGNTWVIIDSASTTNMYSWSSMVYVPERNQLLLWGAMTENHNCPNHVLYFDVTDAKWKTDYVSTYNGAASLLQGKCSLLANNVPRPALSFNSPYYDNIRKKIFYPLPGAMPAYDPATKTWSNSGAKISLYGKNYAGGPPVYWTGSCYDPLNDEIVMFPHGGATNYDEWETTGRVTGHLGTMVYSFTDSTWRRASYTDKSVPGPRSSAPMVYDSANHCIVMFGGSRQDRMLNDTWIYDVQTKLWIEQHPTVIPPPRGYHFMVYLPKEKLILMGAGAAEGGDQRKDLWTYDVKNVKWTHIKGDLPTFSPDWPGGQSFCTAAYMDSLDLVLLMSTHTRPSTGKTMAFRFVLGDSLSPVAWTPKQEATGISTVFPTDQDTIISRLSNMTANQWVIASNHQPKLREWGNIAYDRDAKCVVYYGGGHATYKGDDIELYFPGANKWIRSHTPNWCIYPQHNGYIGTSGVMFNGAPETQHQYQGYQALGGKTYVRSGCGGPYAYGPTSVLSRAHKSIAVYDWQKPGVWSWIMPEGQTHNLGGIFSDYNNGGRLVFYNNYWNDPSSSKTLSIIPLNSETINDLSVTHYAPPSVSPPRLNGEHTQFYCAERNQIIAYGVPVSGGTTIQTWLFDIATNQWTNLNPLGTPPSTQMGEMCYIADKDVIYACPGNTRQGWIYSFKLNRWVAHIDNSPYTFWQPWTKIVYDSRLKILVLLPSEYSSNMVAYICRPEFADSLIDSAKTGLEASSNRAVSPIVSLSASPNPFNPVLSVNFNLVKQNNVSVSVYSADGRLVKILKTGKMVGGKHSVSWNGRDSKGALMASGSYVIVLKTENSVLKQKITLIK